MISKRSALLGLVAAAASAALLADPATAQGAPTAAQVQATANVLTSGTSFDLGPMLGDWRDHRRHHRRRHHRRHHWRHHRHHRHHRWHHGRHHGHHSNSNSNWNRNTNTNTNVNINRNEIEIDP
jgi:hypothetical protein